MEKRYSRKALLDGIQRMAEESDYTLLLRIYELWRYILAKDDN